jgi:hypothetical protein
MPPAMRVVNDSENSERVACHRILENSEGVACHRILTRLKRRLGVPLLADHQNRE